jgi:hypothetical protein
MEEKKIERDLMSQEEFENYIYNNSGMKNFNATSMYKSVGRAIRRGHMLPSGIVYPKRPFNNRANTSKRRGVHSRVNNELKKCIYGELQQYKS